MTHFQVVTVSVILLLLVVITFQIAMMINAKIRLTIIKVKNKEADAYEHFIRKVIEDTVIGTVGLNQSITEKDLDRTVDIVYSGAVDVLRNQNHNLYKRYIGTTSSPWIRLVIIKYIRIHDHIV